MGPIPVVNVSTGWRTGIAVKLMRFATKVVRNIMALSSVFGAGRTMSYTLQVQIVNVRGAQFAPVGRKVGVHDNIGRYTNSPNYSTLVFYCAYAFLSLTTFTFHL